MEQSKYKQQGTKNYIFANKRDIKNLYLVYNRGYANLVLFQEERMILCTKFMKQN